jgi:hypothetical protein
LNPVLSRFIVWRHRSGRSLKGGNGLMDFFTGSYRPGYFTIHLLNRDPKGAVGRLNPVVSDFLAADTLHLNTFHLADAIEGVDDPFSF